MTKTHTHLTFYNQVKTRFPPRKGVVYIITLDSDDVKKLTVQTVEGESLKNVRELVVAHLRNNQPYAVVDFEFEDPQFYFRCFEFEQEENLRTGEITMFEADPFREIKIDREAVRKQFQHLHKVLTGSS